MFLLNLPALISYGGYTYSGHSIDTMIEEMDGGGMYNILGEQEDDYRSNQRTGNEDDGYIEVSESPRYF